MDQEKFMEEEIQKSIKKGALFTSEDLKELKKKLEKLLTMSSYEEGFHMILKEMMKSTDTMYRHSDVHGFSSGIHTMNTSIYMYVGKSIHNEEIDFYTSFDVASITKLFTTILTLKLSELNILSLDEKVKDILPKYSSLDSYTIKDLLYMKGEIKTPSRMDRAKNKEEALTLLQNSYIFCDKKETYKYTDIGFILLPYILCRKVKDKLKIEMTYEQILEFFLLKPYHLEHTKYHAKERVAGNGRKDLYAHDPKTRILGGVSGSAGLFTNSIDLHFLSKALFEEKIISSKNLHLLHQHTFGYARGIGGLYQKYPDFSKTYVPNSYSNASFASEGFTGSLAIFDVENKIHNSFLIDVIKEDKKGDTFRLFFNQYIKEITDETILLNILNHFYRPSFKELHLKL